MDIAWLRGLSALVQLLPMMLMEREQTIQAAAALSRFSSSRGYMRILPLCAISHGSSRRSRIASPIPFWLLWQVAHAGGGLTSKAGLDKSEFNLCFAHQIFLFRWREVAWSCACSRSHSPEVLQAPELSLTRESIRCIILPMISVIGGVLCLP